MAAPSGVRTAAPTISRASTPAPALRFRMRRTRLAKSPDALSPFGRFGLEAMTRKKQVGTANYKTRGKAKRRQSGECRCGKQMRDTTSAEDLKRHSERRYWQCDSCGWRAHKDKGKKIECFSPTMFRDFQNLRITAPRGHTSCVTNYRLKGLRPGGPFSHKTY